MTEDQNRDHSAFFPMPEDESQETTPLESMIAQTELQNSPQIGASPTAEIVALPEQTMPDNDKDDDKDDDKEDDAFRTIGEVADMLDVPTHVVRFWGARFGAIKPIKGQGGRRYYREEDIELLRGLRHLLHEEGYTIKGVHLLIRKKGLEFVRGKGERAIQSHDDPTEQILYGLVVDLKQIKERLQKFAA